MTAVYVAARWGDMHLAQAMADSLRERGVGCTSRWLQEDPNRNEFDPGYLAERAQIDVDDVRSAFALVLVNTAERAKTGTGGCHVETGLALAQGKPVFIYGPRTNVFHHLPRVRVYDDVDRLVADLRQVQELMA